MLGFHLLSQELFEGFRTFTSSWNGDFIDIYFVFGLSHPIGLISTLVRGLLDKVSIEAATATRIFFISEVGMHAHMTIFFLFCAASVAILTTMTVAVEVASLVGALRMLRLLWFGLSHHGAWPHNVDILFVALVIAIVEVDALDPNSMISAITMRLEFLVVSSSEIDEVAHATTRLRWLLVLIIPSISVLGLVISHTASLVRTGSCGRILFILLQVGSFLRQGLVLRCEANVLTACRHLN